MEKFHAIVKMGVVNSRMKNSYDIRILSREFAFKGGDLAANQAWRAHQGDSKQLVS